MTQNVQECYFNPLFIFLNKTVLSLSLVNVMCLLGKSFLTLIYLVAFSITVNKILVKGWACFCLSLCQFTKYIYWFGHLEFKLLNWRQMFFEQRLKGGDWSEILTRLELKTLIITASLICHQNLWVENMALDFLKMLRYTPANGLCKPFSYVFFHGIRRKIISEFSFVNWTLSK